MATASSTLLIALGTPTTVVSTLTILSVGSDGDPTAKGLLTHPDSANFVPIIYARNPDFTSNLDNDILIAPDARIVQTSTAGKLVRTEGVLSGVEVVETWGAQPGSRISMPTFFFRQLYEYLINPPAFDATTQTFITWTPRYRSLLTWNVHLFKIIVGSGSGAAVFTPHEFTGIAGPIRSAFEDQDVNPTGFMDQAVSVHFHIVSEV